MQPSKKPLYDTSHGQHGAKQPIDFRPDGDMEQNNRLISVPTVTWSKTID